MTYRIRNVAVAIGLALVAMLLTLFYVINYRRSVQHGQQTVQVYVAAHNITVGTAGSDIVHGKALKATSIPRRSVVPGAISDPNQIASLILTQPLYAGEQVTLRRFSDVHSEGIIGQLKGTMRAVQVSGDPNQLLAGTLQAGDHVDVVANLRLDANTNAAATKIVLRNLTVLTPPNDPGVGKVSTGSGSLSAILAVTDTQAQKLFFVMKNADWTLELRPVIGAADSGDLLTTLNLVLGGRP
jgi:Flp pilus assembly protein CpaB